MIFVIASSVFAVFVESAKIWQYQSPLCSTGDFPEVLVAKGTWFNWLRFHCTWLNTPAIKPTSVY